MRPTAEGGGGVQPRTPRTQPYTLEQKLETLRAFGRSIAESWVLQPVAEQLVMNGALATRLTFYP